MSRPLVRDTIAPKNIRFQSTAFVSEEEFKEIRDFLDRDCRTHSSVVREALLYYVRKFTPRKDCI